MPTRGRKPSTRRSLLADVERALLDALAESPAVHRSLSRLQREGWVLRLSIDFDPDPGPGGPDPGAGGRGETADLHERPAPEPAFRIDAEDLRFLRSVGIDPTRKRRPRRAPPT